MARLTRRALPAALAAALGGCATVPPSPPAFDALAFFEGASTGSGTLRVVGRGARPVTVKSRGRREGDGSLALEQRVAVAGEAPRTRHWRLRAAGPGLYVGTLTDAAGPVTAVVRGRRLTIRYAMPRGLGVVQTLDLAPDRRTLANRMRVARFGLTLARLDETIIRAAPLP